MITHGFFIKSLTVAEEHKPEGVTIEFNKDLTIVFGASDIGKTFIYQCIYYMLGSKEEPKRIKESKKYSRCVLEIESYKGEIYLLKRKLNGGNFELFINGEPNKETLYIDNNKRKGRTISKFLLELVNMREKHFKINKYGQTQELFFQNLRPYFLVNEDDVIVKKSHIIGQSSIFKFLMTGVDDKKSGEVLSPSIIAEQRRNLDLLYKNLKNIEDELKEFGKDRLLNIENIKNVSNGLKKQIDFKKSEITLLNHELELISIKNITYNSKIFCPKCGKELICNCNIPHLVENSSILIKQKKEIIEKIEIITKELVRLEPEYHNYIEQLVSEKLLQKNKKRLIDDIKELEVKILNNEESIKNIRDKKITLPIIKPIESIIFKILKSIKFDIQSVNFSKKSSDFIINGQEREFYGQGYRAIIYTSFVVAVLKHLREMPHQIGFMMIDSPLNAYRAKDEQDKNLSANFYHYFKKESSNGSQIIIFENTPVPDEVKDRIKEIDPNGFLAVESLPLTGS